MLNLEKSQSNVFNKKNEDGLVAVVHYALRCNTFIKIDDISL